MLESSVLEDLIEQNSGAILHRKRVITAFSHLAGGPLLDLLFTITRPPLRKAKAIAATRPKKQPARTSAPAGTVDHRRALPRDPSVPHAARLETGVAVTTGT